MSGSAHAYERDQVVKIINSVIRKVEEAEEISRETLYAELQSLKAAIEQVRAEIGMASPGEINDKHIPSATDELDAVVEATAAATGEIMDACEIIEREIGKIGGEGANAIAAAVTKIYEACSFQDITGQRITKVVKTFKLIEGKIKTILNAMGAKELDGPAAPRPSAAPTGDAALLNGPQMPDKAITQDDIDRLLSEFD